MLTVYEYVQGDKVVFDDGSVHGTGYVTGIAMNPVPLVGTLYIIEVIDCNFHLDKYGYSHIAVHGIHLSRLS